MACEAGHVGYPTQGITRLSRLPARALRMKKQLPRESCFFVVLIGAVFPCYIAQRYRL